MHGHRVEIRLWQHLEIHQFHNNEDAEMDIHKWF
jgi:hypothetical protein